MDIKEKALQKHYEWGGKLEVISRAPINTREDLSLAYTPGVAQPCLEIAKDPELSYKLTRRSNLVAVITDGTAVLGLGDIGGLRRSGPGRYWPRGRYARYGGQVLSVQGIRRSGRVPSLHKEQGSR